MDKATPTPSPATPFEKFKQRAEAEGFNVEQIAPGGYFMDDKTQDAWEGWKMCMDQREDDEGAEVERLAAQAKPPSASALHQRCDTALQSLPDAAYKTMLAALFDDLLSLAAQAAPTEDAYQRGYLDGMAKGRKEAAQAPVQPQAVVPADQRPVNCGTGYCSCIECVVEPTAQAERAPVVQAVQAGEYPPLPVAVAWQKARIQANEIGDCIVGWDYCWNVHEFNGLRIPKRALFTTEQLRAYVDADRASSGAAQAVRMLTREELNDVALSEQVGWGPGEYVEAVQRKFAEVNGLRIPADGKIGDAA